MNKAIIILALILRIIITPFYYLAGGGAKTVEIGTKAQLGLTGIYMTVLSYKEIYPIREDKYYKKYIAFEVLLDGSKERTGSRFGSYVSWDSVDSYNTCGYFYLEGKIGRSKIRQLSLSPPEIVSLFGEDHPSVIGMGKMGEGKKVSGYVIFGLPEEFEAHKFIFLYDDHLEDVHQLLFPKTEIQVVLNNPIN